MAAVAGSVLASPAMASLKDVNSAGIQFSGEVHAASQYNFRGNQLSAGEPSLGLKLKGAHDSGFYAELATDTIKIPDLNTQQLRSGQNQFHNTGSLGFTATPFQDFTLNVGVRHHQFSGRGHVSDLSFTEVFASGHYKGAHLLLSHNIGGTDRIAPGFTKGDSYAELGYGYSFGQNNQYTIGADIGYARYDHRYLSDLDSNVAMAKIRAHYAYDNNLSFQVSHQLSGKTAFGDSASANHNTWVSMSYLF